MPANQRRPRQRTTTTNSRQSAYVYVRRYDRDVRLAAGTASPIDDEHVSHQVPFRSDWMQRQGLRAERCSLVYVEGDSMRPEILDGDTVLVDHTRCEPANGKVFALRTPEGPLVKRLQCIGGRWWARSDNDETERGSRPLDTDDAIIGQVVWHTHEIRDAEPQPANP